MSGKLKEKINPKEEKLELEGGGSTKNSKLAFHIAALALITFIFFIGFFKKGVMMNSSDQVNALGIKTPIQKSMIDEKQIPDWNRGILGGMPTGDALAGDYMYPPSMAMYMTMPSYKVFGLKMIVHVFLAALFFYMMLWKGFAFPPSIALLGAILYAFNPENVSHIAPGHDGKMFVIAWLPFMVWHLKRGLDRPSILSASLMGLGLGMALLTSHIQMTYFILWGLFAYWLITIITTWLNTKDIKKVIPQVLMFWGAIAIGMALGAIQFFPAYEYVYNQFSVRGADRTIETAASWSLHWAEVFSLWVPEFGNWFGWYWSENPFKLNTEYAGLIALLFGLLAVIRKPEKWRIFWAVVALFSVSIALGLHTPIFKLAYNIIPGVKKFRALSMIMFWFSFSTLMLALYFIKDIFEQFWLTLTKEGLAKFKKLLFITMGVVTAITLLFSMKGFTHSVASAMTKVLEENPQKELIFDINFSKQFVPMLWLWWGLSISALALVFFTVTGKIKREAFLWGILIIGAFDVMRVDYKFISMQDMGLAKSETQGVVPQFYARKLYVSDRPYKSVNPRIKELQRELKKEPFRVMFMPLMGRPLSQNVAGAFNLEGLGGFHDNELLHYREFRGQGNSNYFKILDGIKSVGQVEPRLSEGSNLYNVANCKYFLLPYEEPGFAGRKKRDYMVIENRNYLPRLSFSTNFKVVDSSSEALALLSSGFFSSKDTILLMEKPQNIESRLYDTATVAAEAVNDSPAQDSTLDSTAVIEPKEPTKVAITSIKTTWSEYTANRRVAEIEIEKDGIVRLSEVYYPGWTILVDGKEVTPIRADIAWMAFPVTAGKHKIEMSIASPFLSKAKMVTYPVAILLLIYWLFVIISAIKGRRVKSEL